MTPREGLGISGKLLDRKGSFDMPFRSRKHRAFMFIHHPRIARRWAKKYGTKIVPSRKKRRRRR